MGVGTSKGAYYDDAFHHAAAQWDQKYESEDNKSVIQKSVDDAVKDASLDSDPDIIIPPLAVIKGDLESNITDPNILMGNKMTEDNPGNIYNDQGDIVDYNPDPILKSPNDRVSDAFGQLIQSQSQFNEIDAQAK
jgi:hypothetical protein